MKKTVIVVLLLGLIGFLGYKYVYQSHRDIENEKAMFTIEAIEIAKEFSENMKASSEKYLNKTIIITGEITEIEKNALMLNESVYGTFDNPHNIPISILNTQSMMKGRCIGYDELLEVVKLDQASLVEK